MHFQAFFAYASRWGEKIEKKTRYSEVLFAEDQMAEEYT